MAQISVNPRRASQRKIRMPQHTFQLRSEPWQIQPFLIAPVMPGETMRNGLIQARVVSDPIKNPLIGWWKEYYFFYVKHRDLDDRDDLVSMALDLDHVMTSTALYQNANDVQNYFYAGVSTQGFNWVDQCLKRVVEEYFRNEGEAWDTYTIGGMPIASVARQDWMDSLTSDTPVAAEDIDLTDAGGPGGAQVLTSEIEESMRTWFMQSHQGLTNMGYEDWLRTYGVRVPQAEEIHKPELLRFLKEWTYPTNTVDPTDGDPSTAMSWSINDRLDKDRLFKEPGFIFGVTVSRPKVYFSNQKGSAVRYLDDAFGWLPALLSDDARISLREQAANQLPLDNATAGYWVDIRDLYLYGDQFVNFALTETDAGFVALPTAALQKRFAAETDADALFVDAVGGNNLIREDGVVRFMIASHEATDHTPTVNR